MTARSKFGNGESALFVVVELDTLVIVEDWSVGTRTKPGTVVGVDKGKLLRRQETSWRVGYIEGLESNGTGKSVRIDKLPFDCSNAFDGQTTANSIEFSAGLDREDGANKFRSISIRGGNYF